LSRPPVSGPPDWSSEEKIWKDKRMKPTLQKPTKEDLLAGLAMFTGTETWFRHWSGRFTYTEGVKYLAEAAQAFWLIDLIASWSPHPTLRREDFVVWKLTVRTDHTATITADDGDGRALITQDIPFTDFPLDEITLYLTDHVLLLTSEY
jgi:hypothetical protein